MFALESEFAINVDLTKDGAVAEVLHRTTMALRSIPMWPPYYAQVLYAFAGRKDDWKGYKTVRIVRTPKKGNLVVHWEGTPVVPEAAIDLHAESLLEEMSKYDVMRVVRGVARKLRNKSDTEVRKWDRERIEEEHRGKGHPTNKKHSMKHI